MNMLPSIRLGLLALGVLLGLQPARANPALRQELRKVAKDLKQLLDGRSEDSLAVGQFTGPAAFPSNASAGIAQILAEELKAVGITVRKRAKFGIRGEYRPTEIDNPDADPIGNPLPAKLMAVQLDIVVEDSFGKIVTDLSHKLLIKGETAFTEMLGVPLQMTAQDQGPEKRAQKLKESYASPQQYYQGSLISAGKDSPYAVEILVEKQARPAVDDEGLAFVKIQRGERYMIRLLNNSPYEAAARLTVDGLSMFAFSEIRQPPTDELGRPNPLFGEPRMNRVLVPPRDRFGNPGVALIKGWHINNEKTNEFLVTEFAQSAAAKLGHKTTMGIITATFAAAWPLDGQPPQDEPPMTRDPSPGGDGTGMGARIDRQYQSMPRKIGAVRASISVRYTR